MAPLVELLNALGRWLVGNLGRLSVELAILAAVVYGLIRLLRVRSPKVRHVFWGLVLAKPVVAFLVASPVSLYWFLRPEPVPPPPPRPAAAVAPAPAGAVSWRRPARPYARPAGVRTAPRVSERAWWRDLNWYGVAGMAWLAAAGLLTLRLVVGFAYVGFLRQTATIDRSGPLAQAVGEARTALRMRRRVPVAVSDVTHSPILAGALRPLIIVPRVLVEGLSERQRLFVMAHELVHARRFDNLALVLQRLAEVVLFFHPAVWLCGWAMRRNAEAACDYAVVDAFGASADYADSLTRVAEMKSSLTRRLLVNTFAAAESDLAGRVRRVLEGRFGRRTLRWTLMTAIALLLVALVGLPTTAERKEKPAKGAPAKETTMAQDMKYGFRHDPMDYVEKGDSVEAAIVRRRLFGEWREADDAAIEARIAEIVEEQREDGSFGDAAKDTGNAIARLATSGCAADRPELQKAVTAMLRQVRAGQTSDADWETKNALVPANGLRGMCLLGLTDEPEVRRTLQWLADNPNTWLENTCPWGATFVLRALWYGREAADVDSGIDAALDWIGSEMNDAACVRYWDPYAVVAAVGVIDRPKARGLLMRQIPVILRGQQGDGGWGNNPEDLPSFGVLQALKTHGLMDRLRELPPVPPDWEVVRSVPAPEGNLGTMAWREGVFWVQEYESGELIAVSPEDGTVSKRLKLDSVHPSGVGRWGDGLAVTSGDPKRVLQVDPDAGTVGREVPLEFTAGLMSATEVDGKLWVADGWLFPGYVVDPEDSSTYENDGKDKPRLEPHIAGTCANGWAVTGDGVWHTDYFARAMIKSGPGGRLVDWAERPFGWTSGIAWDGKDLWAIDNANGRICLIRKTDTAPIVLAALGVEQEQDGAAALPAERAAVPGLEEAAWGGYSEQQDTVIGALTAAGRALKVEAADYDFLSGVSGSAFRVQIGAEGWRIEAPFATVGFDCSEPAAEALGWRITWMKADPDDAEAVRKRDAAVIESISRGWPVLLAREECSLITGYQDGGTTLLIRQVGADSPGYVPLTDEIADWHGTGIIAREGPPLPRRDAVIASLELAVRLWEAGDVEGFAEGRRAYELWATRLEDDAAYADPDQLPGCLENGYAYCSLDTARLAAAKYLRWVADEFEGETKQHVAAAAELYQQVVDTLREKRDDLPEPWMMFPWDLERIGGWTQEHRHAQARVLREIAALEEKAVGELHAALEAEGVELPMAGEGGITVAEKAAEGDEGVRVEGVSLRDVEVGEGVWGGCLPAAIMLTLQRDGADVSFSDVAAGSGWAFGFSYDYHNWHVAALRLDQFAWLPEQMGYRLDDVQCGDREGTWQFIRGNIDAGRPVIITLGDGGLITGYREVGGKAEFLFDGVTMSGWLERDTPHPMDRCCVVIREGQPRPQSEVMRESLMRAMAAGQEGMVALESYLEDVRDPSKDFAGLTEWFCWATFERLTARKCCAEWLRSAADVIGGEAAKSLGAAADHYERAFESYVAYDKLVHAEEGSGKALQETVRTPERIAALAPLLREGMRAERAAVGELGNALRALRQDVPAMPSAAGAADTNGPVMLEGLEYPKHYAAEMACVEGCLRYLGRDVTAAWIYGATGHAFAMNMRPTVCVSSPYAWNKTLYDLAPNIGCRITGIKVSMEDAGQEFPARQREAWDMVREAIDLGIPCYADRVCWVPDYALVTGYDDVGYYFRHWDITGGPTPWQKLGTEDINVLDVWRVEPCEPKPDDEVVRAALETVLQHAATPDGWTAFEGQRSGPCGFDLWADELEAGTALLDSHAYNAKFWAEYREMAVDFLQEAKRRLPGRADTAFDEAIAHYTVVRDKLAAVSKLNPGRDDANWTDTLQSPEAAALVREAGAAERQGLAALARVVVALGGTPAELPSAEAVRGDGPGSPKATPTRLVLEGVPKVAYYTDRWRFTPFCNALDACLQYLGEPEQYDYLMCTSGAMFRMTWHPRAWDGGNSDILGMADETLEPMRRAFRSAGFEMRIAAKADPAGWPENILRDSAQRLGGELTDEAGFRRLITNSINDGLPVIAFGVIGPPEACVITGYDEKGDVLLGWNCFQDEEGAETEPSGYFRVRDWYPKTRALLLFGDEVGRPDPKELDVDALKWTLQVLRTPRVNKAEAGPAAFEAWAADMLDDTYFPEGNIDVLRARLMCHWDSMTVTATRGSGSATAYLLDIAARNPAVAEHLKAAAECLDGEDVVHGVAPGEEAQMARLADHAVRQQVADSILHARDMHIEAADHIEAALLAAGLPPEEIPRPEGDAAEAADDPAERLVLEDVPKVGFGMIDGNVAMTPFPACLKACLEFMGDDLGFARTGGKYPRDAVYAYLMGTTGAAFRLLWKPGWHGDNVATFAIYDDPAVIFRRGFEAAGYRQIPSGHLPGAEKAERFRSMVVESIRDRGLPVIAHGVIGPPEECIIAGYDEGGRVAVGWNFFQDREIGHAGVEFEPNGMFRKRRWEADTWSMMAIGEKVAMPERRDAYIEALQNALRIMRTPVRGECRNGIAAYDAWAEHILKDDQVAAGGGPDDAFTVHCDAGDVVAEGRYYASIFLTQAAEELPEAKNELLAAAECCEAEHDLVWKMWGEVGSNVPSEDTRREFLKPDVRRRIEPIIRQARDKDVEAADHIEKALLALGVDAPETAGTAAEPAARDAGPTMLDLPPFPKWAIEELGCMNACLEFLDRDVPRAWLYGGTAHAFFINVHEDVDVEAVTAWDHSFIHELVPNLGFSVDGILAVKPEATEEEFRTAQREAWLFVRRSIQLGQPCYGWELKAPYGGYWLITGYDDVGYYYDGWETGGPTPWQKLGELFIPILEVRNVKLCEPAPDEVVVRDALVAALEHSSPDWDASADDDAHFGPDAFDAWAEALETGTALHNHHAYNVVCWHECREMAVEFLEQAKDRLPGRAGAAFDEAIAHYTVVRDKLAALKELTPIDPTLGWDEEPKLKSPEAAALVREAGAAERRGLDALRRIAVDLGAGAAQTVATASSDGSEGMTTDKVTQGGVLLEDAVADFKHIADDVAGHRPEVLARGATEDFYPQPYCRLTTMLVQMHAAGWKEMDFDTLAAVSGASAMFGCEPNEFEPKYAWHLRDPNVLVAQAAGYATEAVRAATAEDAWRTVRESVDSGRPVSAWEGEMILFAGYQDADDPAGRKVFAMKDGNGYYAEWWGWDRFAEWFGSGRDLWRHSGRVEPKPAKEVALRVMGDLVALSAGVPNHVREAFPNATFGLAGIEAWAAECADMETHEDWGMCHPENPQWTVRNSTAVYLERVADSGALSAEATEHVRRAAAGYRAAYRCWQKAYGLVGYAAPDGSGKVEANRLAAAQAVREAAAHEKAAIAELREALDVAGS